jgi:uncharacterized membrane protein
MSEVKILLLVVYAGIVMLVFFGSFDSTNSSDRQIAANALFWPIFGLIHLVIGFIENIKDLNR